LTASDGIRKAEPDGVGLNERCTVLRVVGACDGSKFGIVANQFSLDDDLKTVEAVAARRDDALGVLYEVLCRAVGRGRCRSTVRRPARLRPAG
jgi:hypothetical protein